MVPHGTPSTHALFFKRLGDDVLVYLVSNEDSPRVTVMPGQNPYSRLALCRELIRTSEMSTSNEYGMRKLPQTRIVGRLVQNDDSWTLPASSLLFFDLQIASPFFTAHAVPIHILP